MASVPFLGTKDHALLFEQKQQDAYEANKDDLVKINPASQSIFVMDQTVNPHVRFPGIMQSIRERRGEKVNIQIPIFQDKNTDMVSKSKEEPYPGKIYMDSMHFGMGCSCLQLTYETETVNHARYLHDMLLPFTPIQAVLSASAPIYKGKLSDIDLRWTVISQSVDCRNPDERDSSSPNYIPKSRYSPMNHYISNHAYVKQEYFDAIPVKCDPE